jgi:hypothetical protein
VTAQQRLAYPCSGVPLHARRDVAVEVGEQSRMAWPRRSAATLDGTPLAKLVELVWRRPCAVRRGSPTSTLRRARSFERVCGWYAPPSCLVNT